MSSSRKLRFLPGSLALASAVWGIALAAGYGQSVSIGPWRISSRNPIRPAPAAAILTTAHVGPLRYYGGRLTVRYDVRDPEWLDRALAWLDKQGRTPYILLEEQEVEEFTRRFAANSQVARLKMTPAAAHPGYGVRP